MKKYELLMSGDTIIRILEINDSKVLIQDCIKKTMSVWVDTDTLDAYAPCSKDELMILLALLFRILIRWIQNNEKPCMTDTPFLYHYYYS